MATSMNDIKILRAKTGAGFADCKKAIDKAAGNIEEAEKLLKKIGLIAAAKRSERATGEGSIFTATNDTHVTLLELACETDFVARNEEFQTLGKDLAGTILDQKISKNTPELTTPLVEKVTELIATIKENMTIIRFTLIEKQPHCIVSSYVHGNPSRLGALVTVRVEDTDKLTNAAVQKYAHSCALHAVAKTPLFLSPETIDQSYKDAQIEIYTAQAAKMDKPENITQGIILGKWKKHLNEICFLLQPWVHDEKSTAGAELKKIEKELGTTIQVSDFTVYVLGSQ